MELSGRVADGGGGGWALRAGVEALSGNYIVCFDPIDGSSNIDAAIATGSIFGIYTPVWRCRLTPG